MDNCSIDKSLGKILLMYDFFLFDAMTYLRNQSLNKSQKIMTAEPIVTTLLIVTAASFKENSGYQRLIFKGLK